MPGDDQMPAHHVHSCMTVRGPWAKTRKTFQTLEEALQELPRVPFQGPSDGNKTWNRTIGVYHRDKCVEEYRVTEFGVQPAMAARPPGFN